MIATVMAHAKLTVTLAVTGVRADGYHLIDAEMVTLDLADTLSIDADVESTSLTATGAYSVDMPLDDTNLASKALRLCNRHAAVHLDKAIPHGGGLGGGSADAAAILRWAGYTDLIAAANLGADIPFCMVGGRARVQGIGEIITPLPFVARTFTLVIAPLSCSTPQVYRAWDDLGAPTGDGPNDLEPAALVVEPQLVRWRDRIREVVGKAPTLAGSGATWFVDGRIADLAAALPDAHVMFASTVA